MAVFVDTGAILALLIKSDDHHAAAASQYADLQKIPLVTSDDIFDETITRLRRKVSHAAAMEAGRALREGGRIRILPLTREDRDRAWALFETYGENVKSLTDCTSVALMERLGIEQVFTFDRDFKTMGKTVIGH